MFRCKIITALLLLLFCSSCITRALWDRKYDETFRQFLVSKDGEYIVFLGNDYHYIFTDNSTAMKELLSWKFRTTLFIDSEKTYLKLDVNNNIQGYATISTFSDRLAVEDVIFLQALGFRREEGYLSLKLKLSGRRYLARSDLGYNLPELNRTYVISIHTSSGIFGNIAKVALTPITITADSALIIGKVLLAPFKGN